MAMVLLRHIWYEFFGEQKVRNSVDIKDTTYLLFRFIKDILVWSYAGVVDEDGWFAVC
jgi:hypothetical protein